MQTFHSWLKVSFVSLLCSVIAFMCVSTIASAQPEELPEDYKKWGEMAVGVAKLNYTDSELSDYQYKGREAISETQAKDTFEIVVKDKNRSFTVKVIILFNPKTDSLMSLSIDEGQGA